MLAEISHQKKCKVLQTNIANLTFQLDHLIHPFLNAPTVAPLDICVFVQACKIASLCRASFSHIIYGV